MDPGAVACGAPGPLMRRSSFAPYLVLCCGVLIVSTSSVIVTNLQRLGVGPLAIAAGRLAIAALILTPLAWGRSGATLRALRRRDLLWGLGAGAFLAVHFASWIASLAYTSVASSTALVSTNPVFVALFSWLILRERLARGAWAGTLLTVLGAAIIGVSDSAAGNAGTNPLLGDALALLGAAAMSGYFLIGRDLRARLPTLPYIWLIYGTAALVLLAAATLAGQPPLGLDPRAALLLLALALGPQLLGHTSFNWALGHLSATFVAVAILGEPIGAALLALLLLDQPLRPIQLLGGVILLAGIAVAMLAEHRTRRAALAAEGAAGD